MKAVVAVMLSVLLVAPSFVDESPLVVRVNGTTITSERWYALSVLPGETIVITVETDGMLVSGQSRDSGELSVIAPGRWSWEAPMVPGPYSFEISGRGSETRLHLQFLVLVPFDHSTEALNGFRIGRYQSTPLRVEDVYLPPRGFVEVTEDLVDLPVSPNFKLGQFLCKQSSGWPKYLYLRDEALQKLELVHDQLERRGIEGDGIVIMSAFRTPYYNKLIGNRTKYSRHLYGGGIDFYVDNDADGRMDDLNQDGRIDRADARFLAELVESLEGPSKRGPMAGGLGIYGSKGSRGPFVHMDVRGVKTRW